MAQSDDAIGRDWAKNFAAHGRRVTQFGRMQTANAIHMSLRSSDKQRCLEGADIDGGKAVARGAKNHGQKSSGPCRDWFP
jgi:hypothetical protein